MRYFLKGEEITEAYYKQLVDSRYPGNDLETWGWKKIFDPEGAAMDNRNGWGDKPREVRGVKHDFNKPQMSLLPMRDLEGVARVLEYGVEKYARGDWKYVEDGAFRYLDAALRHAGELTDATTIEELRVMDHESGLLAIDHAICSLIFARHFIMKGENDDQQAVPISE